MRSTHYRRERPKSLAMIGSALASLVVGAAAFAADTDIASSPLSTSSPTAVKANVMFTLDDSGSMGSTYMPDDMSDTGQYGYWSAQCNGLAYNPAIIYALPVDSTGVDVAAGSLAVLDFVSTGLFTGTIRDILSAAPTVATGSIAVTTDGGSATSYTVGQTVMLYSNAALGNWMMGTVTAWNSGSNLLTVDVTLTLGSGTLANPRVGKGDARPAYYTYTGSEQKLGWTYNSSGVITSTTFYGQCRSNIGSAPGSGVFTYKLLSSTSGPVSNPDERQNYANWYAYYRTRMAMMKSGVSLAFKGIDDKYRIGFNKISNTSVTGSNFLDIADFGATQKLNFYTKLNAATSASYTPLRGAMSKVGQYFANKRSGQVSDPIQYSCQKNFHILSTDGYWNIDTETATYGPKALDNIADVGQQDGTAARPMFDGLITTVATAETWSTTTVTVVTTDDTPQSRTVTDTTTTTHTTPTTWARTNQSSWTPNPDSARNNRRFQCTSYASGTCTVLVRTTTNHGFNTGDRVIIAGVTPALWNTSGLADGAATITRIDADEYIYTLTGLSSAPATTFTNPNGTSTRTSSSYNYCGAGRGPLTSTPQTGNASTAWTTSDIVTTIENRTSSQEVKTTTVVTPYTRNFTVVNGVTTIDSGPVAGLPTATVNVVTSTYVPGASSAPVNSTSSTSPVVSQPSSWVDGTPVTTTPCASSAPAVVANPTGTGADAPVTGAAVHVDGAWADSGTGTVSNTVGPNTTVGTVTSIPNVSTSGGSSNALADVAMYYYKTDLRDGLLNNCQGALGAGTNVCGNNVVSQGNDVATWQHMTTFTLGLGVNGILKYDKNYLTQASGDYNDLKQGTKDWAVPGDGKEAENIDDLWHAAVNGRGQYFSATDPATLSTSLSGILAAIVEKIGSASGAAASNLQPVPGDNKLFVAQYTSGKWVGDVLALTIDPVTGIISPTVAWSAKTQLNSMVAAGTPRNIYYFKSGAPNNLQDFTYANLGSDGLSGHVDNVCGKSPALSQCATLTAGDVTIANTGSYLVTWLRGAYNAVYRLRDSPLGDIIGGAPVFVSKPPFKYTENNYASFASTNASRAGTVYVAANDGMLHAIDGNTGVEKWAFMPSAVLANLYKLADNNYASNHQYLLDGAPSIGEVWTGSAWKTILVGGLGAGGRSYYALDITNPNTPIALWEFTDTHLGLTLGNPIITKRATGTWVVAFASGYNNNVAGGDGNGRMYVLNAVTGALITAIETNTAPGTPAGTVTTPSGLAKLNVWVDSEIDNTAKRFYGGDVLGNVWRFDLDGFVAPNNAALRLAQLVVGSTPQPITTMPALAEVTQSATKYPIIYVATGKYLGTSDLSNTALQSVYALKDPMVDTELGNVRMSSTMVAQTLTTTTDVSGAKIRTGTKNAVTWSSKDGWYVDLPSAGERVNVDPQLLFNTLTVAANIPNTDACTVGGESFLYRFDIGTGGSAINGSDTVGSWLGNSMVVGLSFVQLQKAGGAAGSGDTITITVDNAGNTGTSKVPEPSSAAGATKRTSWREIVN
jgi:type IV pilus assembly protein PilY1